MGSHGKRRRGIRKLKYGLSLLLPDEDLNLNCRIQSPVSCQLDDPGGWLPLRTAYWWWLGPSCDAGSTEGQGAGVSLESAAGKP